ncbi:MAG: hypothetical protein QM784_25185 [Polyangiaceae bacterium]
MLKAKRTLPVALTIAAGLLWQNEARAQNITFYMDRAQISGAPDDGYMVWRPYLHEKTRFYGMLSLGYTHNPLRKEAATSDSTAQQGMPNLVTGQFLTYLNIGTEVSGWFGFNVSQPISLYTMYGDQYDSTVDNRPDFTADERMGLHDTRLDLRVKAYQSNDRKLRLGAGTAISSPRATARAPSQVTTRRALTCSSRANTTSEAGCSPATSGLISGPIAASCPPRATTSTRFPSATSSAGPSVATFRCETRPSSSASSSGARRACSPSMAPIPSLPARIRTWSGRRSAS